LIYRKFIRYRKCILELFIVRENVSKDDEDLMKDFKLFPIEHASLKFPISSNLLITKRSDKLKTIMRFYLKYCF